MSVASQTNLSLARHGADRVDYGSDDPELRGRQLVISGESIDLVDSSFDSGGTRKDRRGLSSRIRLADSRNTGRDLCMALPVGVGAVAGSANSPGRNLFRLVFDRVLDFVPYPKNVLNTVLPISVLLLVVELILAALFSIDWLGLSINAIVGTFCGSVPLLLFLLKLRADKRKESEDEHHLTGEGILKLAQHEREKILEATQHLREEERAFVQRQIEKSTAMEVLSRQRSHLFANAFTGMELANTALIELLEANNINVPPNLKPQTLRIALWKQLDAIAAQESGIADLMVRNDPPTGH